VASWACYPGWNLNGLFTKSTARNAAARPDHYSDEAALFAKSPLWNGDHHNNIAVLTSNDGRVHNQIIIVAAKRDAASAGGGAPWPDSWVSIQQRERERERERMNNQEN
jgi:hypothetical protein